MSRENVIKLLQGDVVKLEFIKADGSLRMMNATLDSSIVPYTPVKTDREISGNSASQPVWDVDSSGWRSFRWDSLREVNDVLYTEKLTSE